jgi:hypothetical protein
MSILLPRGYPRFGSTHQVGAVTSTVRAQALQSRTVEPRSRTDDTGWHRKQCGGPPLWRPESSDVMMPRCLRSGRPCRAVRCEPWASTSLRVGRDGGGRFWRKASPLPKPCRYASPLETWWLTQFPGGAPRLAALIIADICPMCALFAPCQPGAALRDLCKPSRFQGTRRRANEVTPVALYR